jgi:predicted glycoside hydrolase/deacetylase ChbG (UPF0249 family)
MTVERQPRLIINADDFGQTFGINRGIAVAHERGIVTSASLMVRWPASAAAADYARMHPLLSIGLHVDLGEWACRDGNWSRTYSAIRQESTAAVADEVKRQYIMFRQLVGSDPTHLDSHQHVHREEPARTILQELAAQLGLPLREYSQHIHYCGDFYGQTAEGGAYPEGITLENLLRIVSALQPGVTELGCHPGLGKDLPVSYAHERVLEVRVLCDPRLRTALDERGVELLNFTRPSSRAKAAFRTVDRRSKRELVVTRSAEKDVDLSRARAPRLRDIQSGAGSTRGGVREALD